MRPAHRSCVIIRRTRQILHTKNGRRSMFSYYVSFRYLRTDRKKTHTRLIVHYIYIPKGTRRAYGMARLVILSPGHIYTLLIYNTNITICACVCVCGGGEYRYNIILAVRHARRKRRRVSFAIMIS